MSETEITNSEQPKCDSSKILPYMDNIYGLFDPERKVDESVMIQICNQQIPCIQIFLAFLLNTRKYADLEGINDLFIESVIKSFDVNSEVLLEKLKQLVNDIKLCIFVKERFYETKQFYVVWQAILDHFMQSDDYIQMMNNLNIEETTEEQINQTAKCD